jgi:hypothetical protein
VPSLSANSHLFQLLVQAYLDCRRTKRNSASALAFEANAERNLFDLHDELVSGEYQPGRSICFVITHPKPREVWAAEFRDRIAHHLLYNEIAPGFHRRFVADSCACIPGRGTLYAAKRLEGQVRSYTQNWSRPAHYLKCDLANFFVSIDKSVLLEQLQDADACVRQAQELLKAVSQPVEIQSTQVLLGASNRVVERDAVHVPGEIVGHEGSYTYFVHMSITNKHEQARTGTFNYSEFTCIANQNCSYLIITDSAC